MTGNRRWGGHLLAMNLTRTPPPGTSTGGLPHAKKSQSAGGSADSGRGDPPAGRHC
ncbi:MAG: hypothetical protein VB853_15580 [Pirellulales bacterium]